MVLVTLFYLRLILGEEAFLAAQLGEPYREYLRAVPRFVLRLRATLPRAPAQPNWAIALLTEINPIGIFFTMAVLPWCFDNLLMIKAVLVSFGLSLVIRGFMQRGAAQSKAA
jgi:hypothetical protein